MKKLIIILIIVLTSISSATLVEWSIEDGGNGHSYEVVSAHGCIDWTDARNASISLGGHLATITSAEENDFIFSLIDNQPQYWTQPLTNGHGPWLGGYQPDGSSEPAGNWQWVSGESFDYTNWSGREPSNGRGGENKLHYFGYQTLYGDTWNDLFNSDDLLNPNSYIVEYVPEPATLFLMSIGGLMLRRNK